MENVTDQLLADLQHAVRGPDVLRAVRAAPAKKLTPALQAELDRLSDPREDLTMGYLSNVLAYSRLFDNKKRHANILRLIKGGHIQVYKIYQAPPSGTRAARESPYGSAYYILSVEQP